RRYASAQELAEDLRRFLADEPICDMPASVWRRTGKWIKRRPAVATLVGVVAVSILGIFAFILWHNFDLATQVRLAEDKIQGTEQARRAEVERQLRTRTQYEKFFHLRDKTVFNGLRTSEDLPVNQAAVEQTGREALALVACDVEGQGELALDDYDEREKTAFVTACYEL